MSTGTSTTPNNEEGVSPVVFTAVLATVGALVGLLAIIMIIIFIVLCMKELLKRHAKERRATDRVNLLKDDQLGISSDQEEEFTTSIDQDTTTVRVDQTGEPVRKRNLADSFNLSTSSSKKQSRVDQQKSGGSSAVTVSSSNKAPMHGQAPSGGTCSSASLKHGDQPLVLDETTLGGGMTSTGKDSWAEPRKVRKFDEAEVRRRALKIGKPLSETWKLCQSCPLTPEDLICCLEGETSCFPYENIPRNHIENRNVPPEEGSRNRYRDILPASHTRVRLTETVIPGSTYINANYVRGLFGEEKAYIAAQGPLFNTMGDFWRMTWENNVHIIVMLTNFYENGRNKCEKYWPLDEKQSVTHESFEVTNNKIEMGECYTTTEIILKNLKTDQRRIIHHFWYATWTDHGSAKATHDVLKLRKAVDICRSQVPKSPVVVHCSAGIGRTGSFIAIDMGIQQYGNEGVVDIVKYICELRQDRGGMVQTKTQYDFIHQVLRDYIFS